LDKVETVVVMGAVVALELVVAVATTEVVVLPLLVVAMVEAAVVRLTSEV
jgi:hypothetical protein